MERQDETARQREQERGIHRRVRRERERERAKEDARRSQDTRMASRLDTVTQRTNHLVSPKASALFTSARRTSCRAKHLPRRWAWKPDGTASFPSARTARYECNRLSSRHCHGNELCLIVSFAVPGQWHRSRLLPRLPVLTMIMFYVLLPLLCFLCDCMSSAIPVYWRARCRTTMLFHTQGGGAYVINHAKLPRGVREIRPHLEVRSS